MIQPTVGRVVFVRRSGNVTGQPEAAFVTYVHSDRCINVGGFDANGSPFGATSVQLLQDDDVSRGGTTAEWMPYQKGQAAKTEALEKQIGAGG